MKILFDNCTSPRIASTLHGFIQAEGHEAYHMRDIGDLPNGRHSTDLEWISYLRAHPESWAFISGDGRVLKNAAERAALRSAGLHGFILAPGFLKSPIHQMASLLVWRWPEILRITELVSAPSMHEIPIGRSTKLRQLPV